MIRDQFDRTFKVLRLSLTNSCNFSCSYCVPEGIDLKSRNKKSSSDTLQLIDHVAKVHKILDLEAVRLTGGEPLLYYDVDRVIKGLVDIGIPTVKMTTNAFLLPTNANKLKQAGLQEVNISLDAVEEEPFHKVTGRRALNKVLEGIDAAIDAGLNVKLNAVIKRGENDTQVLSLLDYAKQKGVVIRYLELMSMGHLFRNNNSPIYTQQEILADIESKYAIEKLERETSSTANYWKTNEGQVFGVIANESSPFCHDCNRLRMDHTGKVYGCISDHNGIELSSEDDELTVTDKLKAALKKKQQLKFTGSKVSMIDIGG